jgi:AAA+ superfamily predicted ATPase
MTDPVHELAMLVRSRYGLIVVDTAETERLPTLLRLLASELGVALFSWSRTKGLRRDGNDNAVYGTTDASQALAHMTGSTVPAVYHLESGGAVLGDAAVVELLVEAAQHFADRPGALVLAGRASDLPEAARRHAAVFALPAPGLDEYRNLLRHLLRDLSRTARATSDLTPAEEDRLVASLRGLTLLEAEKVLTRAIVEDGRLTADDIAHVIDAKKAIVEREGVLEYYPVEETLAEVADLAGLKAWLAKRTALVSSPDRAERYGLEFPKGMLLIGVPGCGKSLCARAVAMEWRLPLLKLDPGALYNKYIGETEKNFRRATETAERVAPCVLFIDELEKAFASGGSEDGGVSQRVLGSFLSWLQDRRGDVFTVATANDVSRLPPEFLRKGRFDEIFFVDLPDADARRAILEIHLRRRRQDPLKFSLDGLVAATDGFSGAEIEQVVVAALYTVLASGGELETAALLAETARTRPLSVMMAERVSALREWAKGRTVSANQVEG